MSLAASQDFTRETVAPHCASCERRRKEEPHHHLRAGIVSLRHRVEMRECGGWSSVLAYITDCFARRKEEEEKRGRQGEFKYREKRGEAEKDRKQRASIRLSLGNQLERERIISVYPTLPSRR
ncbi:hypothetical protein POPTR_018G089150v4 [Populus trichocarpa]|jgi:hypothetical protein|uniref:Uncharacterized protein n=1 Tax=Populus trichocarpa TaxID=3694 RepID=A0A3N7G7U1_POPTR|nr:hypothetical protein POPTR_018G089150v4 [Populus trichocarpa]